MNRWVKRDNVKNKSSFILFCLTISVSLCALGTSPDETRTQHQAIKRGRSSNESDNYQTYSSVGMPKDNQDQLDMGYILEGDSFKFESRLVVPFGKSDQCFRDGKPVNMQSNSSTWTDSCCIRFSVQRRELDFQPGATIEVAKGKHRSKVVEADYVSNQTFTTGGWEPFHFVKPGLVGYRKYFVSANDVPISNSKIRTISCYGPAEWYVDVRVGNEDVPRHDKLNPKVSIAFMKKHLKGILSYNVDPLRHQPIVIGDAKPHAGSEPSHSR